MYYRNTLKWSLGIDMFDSHQPGRRTSY